MQDVYANGCTVNGTVHDLSQRTDESVCPLAVVNLSSDQYIEMPKNHVLAFAKKDEVEVESCFDIEEDPDPSPRNWIPRQPRRPAGTIAEMMSGIPRTFTGLQKLFTGDERQSVQPVAEVDVVKTETDLHQILTSASNFIKSPAEVETHRKVDLDDAATSEETKVFVSTRNLQNYVMIFKTLFPKVVQI